MLKIRLLSRRSRRVWASLKVTILLCGTLMFFQCTYEASMQKAVTDEPPVLKEDSVAQLRYTVLENVQIKNYFEFIHAISVHFDSLLPYPINEYILVHHNPWIMDTLVHSDYYYQMERGHFVYDQTQMVVLPKGSDLIIPTEDEAAAISQLLTETVIDLNIPEFKIRDQIPGFYTLFLSRTGGT